MAEQGTTVECSICGKQAVLLARGPGPLTWFMEHRDRWHTGRPIVSVEVL